jgi:type II secretory pathway component GspD/PulD (secretin)
VPPDIQIDQDGLVTMHINELDLRKVLEFLSRRSGANILVSPRVSGTITANFEGVTLQKVIDSIIKLANLVDKQEGTLHYIYTKEEVQDEAEFTKKERILTKVYKLSYVRADEILGVIRPFLSADVGRQRISVTPSYRFGISESATFVSGGGMSIGGAGAGGGGGTGGPGGAPPTGGGPTIGGFQPPTGGNSIADYDHLIIQDYESNLQIIDQIIQRIDVRPIQVLIEAVIISVDYEHDRELGVNLGLVDNLGTALGTLGSGTALNGNVGFTPTNLLTTAGKIAQGTVTDAQGFTSATNGIKFGFVSNNVTGFIRALETIGSTKILASPRILVLNKQRAEIQLGSRLGFQTLSQNFTSTIQQVQFLNTGTLLRLRPFVSDDGMVRMEIHPERSSGTVTNNIPNQQTAELTTNVMVPDGATLVIGGLIEDEDDYSYQGLPIASRFPALSFLTGINSKQEGRRELVVLLTPHIWSVEQAMAHAPAPPLNAAFSASGPVANTSTTFDLETGRPGAGNGSAGPLANASIDPSASASAAMVPGAMASAPMPGAPANGLGDQRASVASSGGPAQPAGGMGASGKDADPWKSATPQRRRWPSLREWMSRRSREKQGDPSAGVAAAQPLAQGPNNAAMPPAGDPASAIPGGMSPFPSGPGGQPVPSPQQSVEPESGRPNLDLGPEQARPIGAARNERIPRRDEMLALAAYQPHRADEAANVPEPAEGRSMRPAAATEMGGAATSRVVAGPRRHTIARGETLASIARQYYGSDRYAESLRQFNQGRIARGGLRPGDLLVIPSRDVLNASGGWVVPTRPRLVREPGATGTAEETAPSYRRPHDRPNEAADPRSDAAPIERMETRFERVNEPARRRPAAVVHVVGPDETPRSIARDRLGDPRRASEIIELNQDRLATEGRWRPGLRILLPSDAAPQREPE